MVPLIASLLLALSSSLSAQEAGRDWPVYGGNSDNTHFSSLTQITPANVKRLQVAWTYDTRDGYNQSQMETNPIIINGVLYGLTPRLALFAVNAMNGALLWKFDPGNGTQAPYALVERGLTVSQGRVLFTFNNRLYSIDAKSGRPMPRFGNGGWVDMREGLGRASNGLDVRATSPAVVFEDVIIIGSTVAEQLPSAPGDIRAYDLSTGALRWSFHTIPHPGEFGYDSWPPDAWKSSGGANAWSGLTMDIKRGVVFAATGSAAFDYYGRDRAGDNLFANSVIALDARTGKRVWHYQIIRHDLWDRDLPAAPALVTVTRNGKHVEAVAQITKTGHVFVLNRETGEPLFPVEERQMPAATLPGDRAATTQRFPLSPPAFTRQFLTEGELTTLSPGAHADALRRFREYGTGNPFDTPSTKGTIVFPGFIGGAEWGGAAYDSATGLLFVNANEMPFVLRLERQRATFLVSMTGPAELYRVAQSMPFVDADSYPAIKPPWGTLNAIDLNAGTIRWSIPLGEYPALALRDVRETGSENFGGAIVTKSGLLIIAATVHDSKIRAFDKLSGKLLWEAKLPAAGIATPATYSVNGKQFIVIACGGGKSGEPSGGKYVAFALP